MVKQIPYPKHISKQTHLQNCLDLAGISFVTVLIHCKVNIAVQVFPPFQTKEAVDYKDHLYWQ